MITFTKTTWFTWLHKSPERVVALSIQGTRQRGPFTAADRELLALVLPHFTRTIELKDRLALGAQASDSLLAIADALHTAILVVDGSGKVLEASEVARRILTAADGIYIVAGRLSFRRRTDERAFGQLLTANPLVHSTGPVTLCIPRESPRTALSLLVVPARGSFEPWMTAGQRWIVAILEPRPKTMPTPDAVERAWQVTPAEARVVCLLAGGLSVQQIADTLSVSVHTVRSQLKAVYAKTGLTSQLEVVRRLVAGDAVRAGW